MSLLYFELIHQMVLSKAPSKNYLRHLSELNRTTMPSFEEHIGKKPYEYLKTLEKLAQSQHSHIRVNNSRYALLQDTTLGRAFWLLTRIHFPIEGNICHQYAMDTLIGGEDYVGTAQLFHELACLMK